MSERSHPLDAHILWYSEATIDAVAELRGIDRDVIVSLVQDLDAACELVQQREEEDRRLEAEIEAAGGEDAYWNARGLYRTDFGWSSDPRHARRG